MENGVQEFLWQQFYSSAIEEKGEESDLVESAILSESSPIEKMHIGGEDIFMKKVVKYEAWVRVMYVDIYDLNFYIGFRPLSAKFEKLYNNVAQLDITTFVGEMGKNWKKFKVTHDYRVGVLHQLDYNIQGKNGEWNNNHIIPASKNIRRAFDIIKKGGIVYLEGYWVDWWGKFDGLYDFNVDSPRKIGQYHDTSFLYGGEISEKCRQIYVTKLIYNGYVYE